MSDYGEPERGYSSVVDVPRPVAPRCPVCTRTVFHDKGCPCESIPITTCFCGTPCKHYDGYCSKHHRIQSVWGNPLVNGRALMREVRPYLKLAEQIVHRWRSHRKVRDALGEIQHCVRYRCVEPTFTWERYHFKQWTTRVRLARTFNNYVAPRLTPKGVLIVMVGWSLWNLQPHGPHIDRAVETKLLGHLIIGSMEGALKRHKAAEQGRSQFKHALGWWCRKELMSAAWPVLRLYQERPEAIRQRRNGNRWFDKPLLNARPNPPDPGVGQVLRKA
jgi:hypothetical protein